MTDATAPAALPSRARLWVEFLALFAGVPLLMTAFFGLYPLFPILFGLTLIALLLLSITPGWRWRSLLRGPVLGEWRIVLGFALATALVCYAVIQTAAPHRFLSMPRHNPGLWTAIMVLYPLLSALPQEIIYRSLFFERYGALFPSRAAAIAANGAAFALGHLFFESWITILMTGAGGAIMGWAWLRAGSLGLAWVLHSLAGQILFTFGLGIWFYHGAVG